MENLTYENFMIAGEAMLKITYNFWPVTPVTMVADISKSWQGPLEPVACCS